MSVILFYLNLGETITNVSITTTKAIAIVIPTSIVVAAIAIYFLNMPAWVMVERITGVSSATDIKPVPAAVLENHPKLKDALIEASEKYREDPRQPTTTVMALSNAEGRGLLKALATFSNDKTSASWENRFRIESEGEQFSILMIFRYEPPATL